MLFPSDKPKKVWNELFPTDIHINYDLYTCVSFLMCWPAFYKCINAWKKLNRQVKMYHFQKTKGQSLMEIDSQVV